MSNKKNWNKTITMITIIALAFAIGVMPTVAMVDDGETGVTAQKFDEADKFPDPRVESLPRLRTPAEMSLIDITYGPFDQPSVAVLAVDSTEESEPLPYTVAELEEFRVDFISYMQGYGDVVAAMQSSEWAQDALVGTGIDPDVLPIAGSELYSSLEGLDYETLAQAKRVMDANPGWQSHPAQLEQVVVGEDAEGSISALWLDWSTIEPWDTDAQMFAAKYAAIAAALAMELIPDDITGGVMGVTASVPNPINIGVTIAWSVAEGVVIGYEISADIYADTSDAYLRDHAHLTGERVSAYLDYSVQSVDTRLSTHDNSVTTRFNTVDTALVGLESHLVTQDIDIASLDTHLLQQDADRTARFDFVDGEIATIRAQLDAQDAYLAETRTLMMRMAIEENMLSNAPALATFLLPAADGGRLDEARTIAEETIASMRAAGLSVNNADTEIRRGDAAYAAGDYKEAYERYRAAYQEAVR